MLILGIDEVGRGPLAGPLVVGAVVLPEEEREWFGELKDSKKLSAKKRETLSKIIWREANGVGLGWVSAEELDKIGISGALKLATRKAVKAVQALHANFSQIVIDGKVNFLAGTALEKYVTTVVRADDLIKEVSAASIVAKVARDEYMVKLGKKYPEYGFDKHMGYGTKFHREAISLYGSCPEHRKSFKPVKVVKNTTKVGKRGEDAVCEYLAGLGHEIVARNYKTRMFEIDIVSVYGGKVYFTEVKYRKNDEYGGGLAVIDQRKLEKMKLGARSFMKSKKVELGDFDPMLAVAEVGGGSFAVKDWLTLE